MREIFQDETIQRSRLIKILLVAGAGIVLVTVLAIWGLSGSSGPEFDLGALADASLAAAPAPQVEPPKPAAPPFEAEQARGRALLLDRLEAHRVSRLRFGHAFLPPDQKLPLIEWVCPADCGALFSDFAVQSEAAGLKLVPPTKKDREGGPKYALLRDASDRALIALRAMPSGPQLSVVVLAQKETPALLHLLQSFPAVTLAISGEALGSSLSESHEAFLQVSDLLPDRWPESGGVFFDAAQDLSWADAEAGAKALRDRGLSLCVARVGRLLDAAQRLGTRVLSVTEYFKGPSEALQDRLKALEASLVLNGDAVLAISADDAALQALGEWLKKMEQRAVRLLAVSERVL